MRPALQSALYFARTLRGIEAAYADEPLMQRAGLAAASLAESLVLPNRRHVLILVGPGNNGGDAIEAAIHLLTQGHDVNVVYRDDPSRLPPDAQLAHKRFASIGGKLEADWPVGQARDYGLIIDGLFGIGLNDNPRNHHAQWINDANNLARDQRVPLLALDCPSGLQGDSGVVFEPAIHASHCITFLAAKPGLYTLNGPDHCGEITLADLGVDCASHTAPDGRLLRADDIHMLARKRNCHKGDFGALAILGGARGMLGAAVLAARSALHCGAGSVYVSTPDESMQPTLDPLQPELMWRRPVDLWSMSSSTIKAIVCGPGLGQDKAARSLLDKCLQQNLPLVLDADALNLLAMHNSLQQAIANRQATSNHTLLTPHPKEAARLLDCELQKIQTDRIAAACQLARQYNAHVALKGCGTIIATPSGKWRINPAGNPGMACAGMGDVLAGAVGALIAQDLTAERALATAVYTHAAAADQLVNSGTGPVGLTASELIPGMRLQINALHCQSRTSHTDSYSMG